MSIKSIKEITDIVDDCLVEGLFITKYWATTSTLIVEVNGCTKYVFEMDGVKLLNNEPNDFMIGFIEELTHRINEDYEKIKAKERTEKFNLV